MRGGTLGRLLFFISILGIAAGLVLPSFLEHLSLIDELKAQQRSEATLEHAVNWYLINNGPPSQTMHTEDVKKALIPHYLNRWPGKQPIECTIDPEGHVHIYTAGDYTSEPWIKKVIYRLLGHSKEY